MLVSLLLLLEEAADDMLMAVKLFVVVVVGKTDTMPESLLVEITLAPPSFPNRISLLSLVALDDKYYFSVGNYY